MTVIYFMLSAVYTPKLAIVLGRKLVGLSLLFFKDKSYYFVGMNTFLQ